jgi:hypothetical protein
MIRRIVFSFLVVFASSAAASDASACWNATQEELNAQVRSTIAAQRALDDENPSLAIRLIEQVPHSSFWLAMDSEWPQYMRPRGDDEHSRGRMMRIYALAVARLPHPTQQQIGLARRARGNASSLIDGSAAPSRLADFAEFDAFIGESQRALDVLRPLAEKDLIGSAHAYAALARLEAAQGNIDAAGEALARCNQFVKPAKRTSICVVP